MGSSENNAGTMVCSRCGGLLSSFSGRCPFCGAEIYNIRSSEAVREFSNYLFGCENPEKRISLIKTFPVPNTKEDILEFMILASSHIAQEEKSDPVTEKLEKAWTAKFMQCYQKARYVFEADPDYQRVQKIYEDTQSRIEGVKKSRRAKRIAGVVIRSIGAMIGAGFALIAVYMDRCGENSSAVELGAVIVTIVSACTVRKRSSELIEYGIAAAVGFLLIGLSFLLRNGSMLELGGVVALIITAIKFFVRLGSRV